MRDGNGEGMDKVTKYMGVGRGWRSVEEGEYCGGVWGKVDKGVRGW